MVAFPILHAPQNHGKQVEATVMDTATASSLDNKPLKETEGPLDEASPGPGLNRLPAAMRRKIKQITISEFQVWLK